MKIQIFIVPTFYSPVIFVKKITSFFLTKADIKTLQMTELASIFSSLFHYVACCFQIFHSISSLLPDLRDLDFGKNVFRLEVTENVPSYKFKDQFSKVKFPKIGPYDCNTGFVNQVMASFQVLETCNFPFRVDSSLMRLFLQKYRHSLKNLELDVDFIANENRVPIIADLSTGFLTNLECLKVIFQCDSYYELGSSLLALKTTSNRNFILKR